MTFDILRAVLIGLSIAAIVSMLLPAWRSVRDTKDPLEAMKAFYGLAPLGAEATKQRNTALMRWAIGFVLMVLAVVVSFARAGACGPG
jgi:hypothetical protein